jgi:hypothetical protein
MRFGHVELDAHVLREHQPAGDAGQQPAELSLLASVGGCQQEVALSADGASLAARCSSISWRMQGAARSFIWFIWVRSKARCSAVPCSSMKRSSSVITTLKSTSAEESSA